MTERRKTTRLDHFLTGYEPLDPELAAQIRDRIHRAGWHPDDPASLQIAHDTVMESCMQGNYAKFGMLLYYMAKELQKFPALVTDDMTRAMKKVLEHSASDHAVHNKSNATLIVRNVHQAVKDSLFEYERQRVWKLIPRHSLVILAVVILIAGSGYLAGRSTTSELQSAYAAQHALNPDAESWLKLQTLNPQISTAIETLCKPGQRGYIKTESGRPACALSFWTEGPEHVRGTGLVARTQEYFYWARATWGLEVALLAGAALGCMLSALKQKAIALIKKSLTRFATKAG